MKNFVLAFALLFAALPAAAEAPAAPAPNSRIITAPAPEEALLGNKIYFFAHSMCTACKDAFIYLENSHPELDIPITDMKFHHNLELYKQCVKKFGIKNNELRLPLICMGNSYIMGWGANSGTGFEQALAAFRAETATPAE